jgi:organic hydroperoxide reductase OsmC/OhrA
MSEHKATIRWTFSSGEFLKGRYSREHTWTFDGGVTVPASSSPAAVPKPYSNEANVDPEEAFVASIASCHMLTYLYVASKAGFQIVSYEDTAVGILSKNDRGVPWVSAVTLQPHITYAGDKRPSEADEDTLHHAAHDQCFIANSVKTDITVRRSGDSAFPSV